MSDLSKRLFDLGSSRDAQYANTPDDELVRMRIQHQQTANTIADELEFRQMLAVFELDMIKDASR